MGFSFGDSNKGSGLSDWSVGANGISAPMGYIIWNLKKPYTEYIRISPFEYRDDWTFEDYVIDGKEIETVQTIL
jgi:hypothetical protein